jgi:hypothetical protein
VRFNETPEFTYFDFNKLRLLVREYEEHGGEMAFENQAEMMELMDRFEQSAVGAHTENAKSTPKRIVKVRPGVLG